MTPKMLLILRATALALLLACMFAAAPANACACGAVLPHDGNARVVQEQALVRWDGSREDIVMGLGLQGSSKEAAWILPVPAQATVKLGNAALFSVLQELTKPRIEQVRRFRLPFSFGGSAIPPTAGALPVSLLQRQTLGPFDVSTLAASDAAALGDWLKTNGYNFPPGLAQVLQPYVEQNWFYIAVRLSPGSATESLHGTLDPLWVTFNANTIIYPMRASALAGGTMPVLLYVLAAHRVEKPMAFGSSEVQFADWVEPSSLPPDSALTAFVPGKLFLTKFADQVAPAAVNDDFRFSFASQDTIYHQIEYEEVDDTFLEGLFLVFCLGGVILVPLALLIAILTLVRRRRHLDSLSGST